ncbi:helix-turn-helix domain-containing protein [Bradyrhizobium neotropicale]|uniref:helix-turn-helix domain-containing protein n=1 Tax=Bradyrhizobium neotropicale TaxID=1497615 RepID=UPI001AD61202|nr:helix-turn-helix domain-containing protein [Bradyrhizobium neotropicale]MBO4228367.1 hypothetical protein [Bradyrhizobium neotropicale]
MPKTIPVKLEIEEITLGSVLRKLNDMPGVVEFAIDFGRGGQGAGRKQLEQQAEAKRYDGGSHGQTIIKQLMHGPKHIDELSTAIGGPKSRAYSVVHELRKKGLVELGTGKGVNQLTAAARAQLGGALPALPAPEITHGPAGRASPGSGNVVLRAALDAGPLSPSDLREHMSAKGMSPKSISGVLDRARKHGLIKKNGSGYELTAKGKHIQLGTMTNG